MCWDDIAATLLKDFLAKFGKITARTLRERATNLMEAFLSADVRQRKQSSTEEEFKEKEQLRSLCARNLTTIERTLPLNWPWNGPNNSTNKAPHMLQWAVPQHSFRTLLKTGICKPSSREHVQKMIPLLIKKLQD